MCLLLCMYWIVDLKTHWVISLSIILRILRTKQSNFNGLIRILNNRSRYQILFYIEVIVIYFYVSLSVGQIIENTKIVLWPLGFQIRKFCWSDVIKYIRPNHVIRINVSFLLFKYKKILSSKSQRANFLDFRYSGHRSAAIYFMSCLFKYNIRKTVHTSILFIMGVTAVIAIKNTLKLEVYSFNR